MDAVHRRADKSPGFNALRVTPYNVVTPEQMASLRQIRDAAYAHRSEVRVPVAPASANEQPNELVLFGTRYKVGDKVGSLTYTIDPRDLDGIMRSIRVGNRTRTSWWWRSMPTRIPSATKPTATTTARRIF